MHLRPLGSWSPRPGFDPTLLLLLSGLVAGYLNPYSLNFLACGKVITKPSLESGWEDGMA